MMKPQPVPMGRFGMARLAIGAAIC